MNRGRDKLLRTLQNAADADGHVDTNVTMLVAWTGLSRSTLYNALEQLTREQLIHTEGKRGPGGGLIIRLKNVQNSSKNSSNSSNKRNAFKTSDQGPSGSDPDQKSPSEFVQNSSSVAETPQWSVCCVWYDDNGDMWCHGSDGFDTYQMCSSKEEAMDLAEKHSRMYHKDKNQKYGVLPRVDVCETKGKGKVLHYAYGSLFSPGTPATAAGEEMITRVRARRTQS